MQDVHGRTFGVWTLLTCLLCVMTAFNLDNEALYLVTFLSFVFALGYFLIECFIYQTMAVKNVASLFFFAGNRVSYSSPPFQSAMPCRYFTDDLFHLVGFLAFHLCVSRELVSVHCITLGLVFFSTQGVLSYG